MRLEAGKESLNCEYCGNVYFPQKNEDGVRVLGEPSELACPVCAVPLLAAAFNGQRLLYCNRCRGMLIQMDVFVTLLHNLHAHGEGAAVVLPPPDPKGLERQTDCPQCHHRMDTHFYAGPGNVIIDDCSQCHLNWLDYGELTRILDATEREPID
jgi:Zn-finger nucleic acid-binding protein